MRTIIGLLALTGCTGSASLAVRPPAVAQQSDCEPATVEAWTTDGEAGAGIVLDFVDSEERHYRVETGPLGVGRTVLCSRTLVTWAARLPNGERYLLAPCRVRQGGKAEGLRVSCTVPGR